MIATPAFLGAFKSVPRFVWYLLAAALIYAFAVGWYNGKIADAEKRGEERAYANVAKQVRELERKADALNAKIADAFRRKNDAENRAIARAADDLRLHGPGAARCPGVASIPASPGRHDASGRRSDGSGPQMPSGDSAAVPWGWLVDRAEQADLNRAEVLAWREWHQRFTAEWEKWRKEREKAKD